MPPRTPLCLVLVAVLAGCAAGSLVGPVHGESAPVHIGNSANETYRFEVSIAPVGQNVTVRRRSGDVRTFELGTATAFGAESARGDPITAVELPDAARRYGRYTLAPGEQRELAIEGVRRDEALLVVVLDAEDDTIHGFHGVHCRPAHLADFTVSVRDGPGYVTYRRSSCGRR